MADCRTCFKRGEVLIDARGNIIQQIEDAVLMVPCPDCHCGVEYCCDGIRTQPEVVEEKDRAIDRAEGDG